ncbi:pitrilysin family protein [Cognatishimia sp. F0-27]|uniref:M16 family metallopeptidase n=1 Tax=Cognatishimia sp. F0-27 TaxID=2816855 RepID=UPI001D0C4B42|nr:pitrilysin family protein [Cognatishimia sp. F0-27]MCC1492199.1 insulinase family protein [Cognatishimia sp. F0-27]
MTRLILALGLFLAATVTARAEIDIDVVESPGGTTAWLVQDDSIPFVALELRFKGGASLDLPAKRGATNLMVALLEEGSGDMDARAFAAATEELATYISFDVSDDAVSVSARFLTENRDAAVALLREALVNPRFDQDAIDRVRAQVLSGIRSDLLDPDTIASEAFNAMVFGDHPYGTGLEGTEASVSALSRDDLVAAHQGTIARDRVYAGAAGDITPAELGALLDTVLGDLPETGLPQVADIAVDTSGGVTVVPFDTPQSVAVFGHAGLPRDHPDFFAAFVMNQILGAGGFEARLMTEVREKRGLTYGVYSYLVPKDHAALYMGRVASANDRIAEAVAVISEEWAKMAENGVTEEELSAAKTYLTGAYPLRFDGNRPIAQILVGMQMDDLSPDYVVTRNDRIEAVTLDDVARVASEVLQPDALHFVVVGQPEGLDSGIGQ